MVTRLLVFTGAAAAAVVLAALFSAGSPQAALLDTGLSHELRVTDRYGHGSSGGDVTLLVGRLLPPDEVRALQGRKLGLCARLPVSAGRALLIPEFEGDCPEGAQVGIAVDYGDGLPPISADAIPPIEWRRATSVDGPKTVLVRPVQPRTAGEAPHAELASGGFWNAMDVGGSSSGLPHLALALMAVGFALFEKGLIRLR
jgi:hypothetical protein